MSIFCLNIYMILYFLTLFSAISLSLCSGFFSIYGLTSLFTGNTVSIICMGCSLEVAKIIGTVWIHKNWNNNKFTFFLKSYMVMAIFVLMLITSMGVFGYLSFMHINDKAAASDISFQTSYIEDQILREKQTIESNKKQIEIMDKSLSAYIDNNKVSTGLSVRKSQQQERQEINKNISESYTNINALTQKLEPLKHSIAQISQKLGPIEYVGRLLFDDFAGNTDKAVRAMILLIIFVFDPFAIVLMIAANITWHDLHKPIEKRVIITEPLEHNTEKQILNEYDPVEETVDKKRTTQHFGRVVLND